MYALIKAVPNSSFTAAGIQRFINQEDENYKTFLEEVLLSPYYSQAIFIPYFNPSQLPQTHTFIKKKGIPINDMIICTALGTQYFRPRKWQNYYIYMKGNSIGSMGGTTTLDDIVGIQGDVRQEWEKTISDLSLDSTSHLVDPVVDQAKEAEEEILLAEDESYPVETLTTMVRGVKTSSPLP